MLGRAQRARLVAPALGKVDARGLEAVTSHPCSVQLVARGIGNRLPPTEAS
jgi:hypothetical protein